MLDECEMFVMILVPIVSMQRRYILDVVEHLSKHLPADIVTWWLLVAGSPSRWAVRPKIVFGCVPPAKPQYSTAATFRAGDSDPGTFAKNSTRLLQLLAF